MLMCASGREGLAGCMVAVHTHHNTWSLARRAVVILPGIEARRWAWVCQVSRATTRLRLEAGSKGVGFASRQSHDDSCETVRGSRCQ